MRSMKYLTKLSQVIRDDDGIPTDIKLFSPGENKSVKGSTWYDPDRRGELERNRIANDTRDLLPVDIAHLSLTDVGTIDAHRSYGWWKLSFEEDGIWARDIKWSETALNALRNREFRFISPAFYVDEEGYITEVINFSLTNIPASLNIEPLVASRKEIMEQEDNIEPAIEAPEEEIEIEMEEDLPEMTPEEMKDAIESLKAQVDSLMQENVDLKEELNSMMSEKQNEMVEELSKSGIIGDELKEWAKSLTHEQLRIYAQSHRAAQPIFSKKIETRSTCDTMSPEDKEIYRRVNKIFKLV